MNRDSVMSWLREVFGFGKILSAKSSTTTKTVGVKVEGDEGESSAEDEELWAHAPLLYKPVAPDSTGHCEALFYRLGDEKVVIATKDRRFQIEVADGEVVVTAMGANSPAYIKLKPDGTAVIKSSAVRIGVEGASQDMVLGDTLKSVLEALTVPTAMGPSGTPINAGTFSTFLSTKHKLDA